MNKIQWTTEARVEKTDDGLKGRIVKAGKSMNNILWTEECLQSGTTVFHEARMFVDHGYIPRSINALAGIALSPYIAKEGDDGATELRAIFQISKSRPDLLTMIEEGLVTDVSLSAFVEGEWDDEENVFVAQRFIQPEEAGFYPPSVDFVVYGAADGKLNANEGLQPALIKKETQEETLVSDDTANAAQADAGWEQILAQMTALSERIESMETRSVYLAAASATVTAALATCANLPALVRDRIRELANEQIAKHTDADDLKTSIEAIIASETTYAAALTPNGAPTGLSGTGSTADDGDKVVQMTEYFLGLGMTPEKAAIAARGRK